MAAGVDAGGEVEPGTVGAPVLAEALGAVDGGDVDVSPVADSGPGSVTPVEVLVDPLLEAFLEGPPPPHEPRNAMTRPRTTISCRRRLIVAVLSTGRPVAGQR